MSRYARSTCVSSARSQEEIRATLRRYGAGQFVFGEEPTRALVGFLMNGRQIRFVLPLPDPRCREFTHTPARETERHLDDATMAWEQACRQRWRALALAVKAKLEAVESGIATFETEFLAYIVLPNRRTVGEWMLPQIEAAYSKKDMPALLPWGGEGAERL